MPIVLKPGCASILPSAGEAFCAAVEEQPTQRPDGVCEGIRLPEHLHFMGIRGGLVNAGFVG